MVTGYFNPDHFNSQLLPWTFKPQTSNKELFNYELCYGWKVHSWTSSWLHSSWLKTPELKHGVEKSKGWEFQFWKLKLASKNLNFFLLQWFNNVWKLYFKFHTTMTMLSEKKSNTKWKYHYYLWSYSLSSFNEMITLI